MNESIPPPSPAPPPAPSRPPVIGYGKVFWPVSTILLAVGFLLGLWLGYLKAPVDDSGSLGPEGIGYALGSGVGMILFPVLLSWIAYRCNRRARLPANAVLLAVLMLTLAGNALTTLQARLTTGQGNTKVLREMTTELVSVRDRLAELSRQEEGISNEEITAVDQESFEILKRYQGRFSGDFSALFDDLVQARVRIDEISAEYDRVTAPVFEDGFYDLRGVTAPEQLQEKVRAVEGWIRINGEMMEAPRAMREVANRGKALKSRGEREFVRGMASKWTEKMPLMTEIREQDRIMAEATKEYFELVHREWGKVSRGEVMTETIFEDQAVEARKEELIIAIEEAANLQLEKQREFFGGP